MSKIKYLEKTTEMTKVEQLKVQLMNRLMVDAAVEAEKEQDPEWYEEYSEKEMQDFKQILSAKEIKSIFYEVKTDSGNRYYEDSHEAWDGVWNFTEVTENHFNAIN